MIMVQKFHSIHEIDPEFVSSIELLLEEEVPSFDFLVQKHDKAPETDVFTYFLFFGPTQNAPIGFAQLCLRQLPSKNFIPWYKKLMFWDKSHEHWKQVTWQVGGAGQGMCVFNPKYARTGKEKVQELIQEYESREDVMVHDLHFIKNLHDFKFSQETPNHWSKESFVLDPLMKSYKSYQDYLEHLDNEIKKDIKLSWKNLHKNSEIELGEYPNPLEVPMGLPISEEERATWAKWNGLILTFQKGKQVLGCILMIEGKNGNLFFEPYPFEPEGQALVSDELYIQYAVLKFYEMPQARKCHILKGNNKLFFQEKMDLSFFEDQGFGSKVLVENFKSRLEALQHPL